MRTLWSHRLLTLLQLTRMALVFTAIADGWCGLALAEAWARPGAAFADLVEPWKAALMAAVSIGLYGFGMSLNDIIDRRRDQQISPSRPLPSGRVSIAAAHLICLALLALAVGAGVLFRAVGGPDLSLWLVAATLGLIYFYDAAGKYLVGPGLVALGLVRFAQCMIPAAQAHPTYHPLVWHPLWLLNHVALLSAVCYAWEEKRPTLTARHWVGVVATLLAINGTALWLVGTGGPGPVADNLRLHARLAIPAAASLAFLAVAWRVRRHARTRREAGQATMLYGLLWLIVYDAAFAAAYAHWAFGVGIALLLPVAYLAVKVMRGWAKLVAASHRPEFKRAGA
jgi:4-hydroxybenzoate polyprenyltransferase